MRRVRLCGRPRGDGHLRIRSIVVLDVEGGPWGVRLDLDLAAAAGPDLDTRKVGEVAGPAGDGARGGEPAHAAELMAEHGVSHLVVVPRTTDPVGVLSTLDVAGVLAWGGAG